MQTAVLSEGGYNGPFMLLSSSCTNGSGNTKGDVASVSPSSGLTGPSVTLTVKADDVGTCTYTYTDNHGGSVTLTIDVTTTGVVVDRRHRKAVAPIVKPGVAPVLPGAKVVPPGVRAPVPVSPVAPKVMGPNLPARPAIKQPGT